MDISAEFRRVGMIAQNPAVWFIHLAARRARAITAHNGHKMPVSGYCVHESPVSRL
jgi:hypothetical protein